MSRTYTLTWIIKHHVVTSCSLSRTLHRLLAQSISAFPVTTLAGQTGGMLTTHPVLSLRSVCSRSRTVPSGSTASTPSTVPRRLPYRSSRSPPAHSKAV